MTNTPSYPVSIIAKLFDLTERRVQQLASEGVIPKSIKGKYELVPSVQNYIKYLRERSVSKDSPTNETHNERQRLLKIQANKLEFEVAIMSKDFLPKELVKNSFFNIVARCRSVLLTMPSKLAQEVIGLKEPLEAEKIIKGSVYEALDELYTCEVLNDINIGENKFNGEENNDYQNKDISQSYEEKINEHFY
jgi:phage terminase Nu1 subunit (DNA packaging protein)